MSSAGDTGASASSSGVRPGATVAERYRVVRSLGRGGMGEVFEAENTWTRRRVALKVLHPSAVEADDATARFRQEAQTATALAHPNIVDVLDMGRDPDSRALYIVQELLVGRTLSAHLAERGGTLPLAEALSIMVPVMAALALAHEFKVVHRDVKPDNVFLADDGRGGVTPTLIDFGLAKVLEADAQGALTQTGAALGTVHYMSREQAAGDPGLDGRTDVWSVGVTLYQLLSGHLPFEAGNANLVVFRILGRPATPITQWLPGLDAAWSRVIHRAMEPDLAKRHPSMRAFLDAVLDLDAASGAPGPSLRERCAAALTHRAPVAPPSPSAAPVGRRPRLRSIPLAAALACSVAAAATLGLLGRSRVAPAAPPPSRPIAAPAVVVPERLAPAPPVATTDASAPPPVAAPVPPRGAVRRPPSRPRARPTSPEGLVPVSP